MRVVAIVQARLGSTRLPGKTLLDLGGEPLLAWVVERARAAKLVNEVIVATTSEARDDRIVELCAARSWPCSRGSESDVLERYYEAARRFQADLVVRVTSDCPFTDPGIVDEHVARLTTAWQRVDYVSNMLEPLTYPMGLAVEALPSDVLGRLHRIAREQRHREHVTYYIHEHSDAFRVDRVALSGDFSHYRWTVDTADDLALARAIVDRAMKAQQTMHSLGWRDVLRIVESAPELSELNRHVVQKAP